MGLEGVGAENSMCVKGEPLRILLVISQRTSQNGESTLICPTIMVFRQAYAIQINFNGVAPYVFPSIRDNIIV